MVDLRGTEQEWLLELEANQRVVVSYGAERHERLLVCNVGPAHAAKWIIATLTGTSTRWTWVLRMMQNSMKP